MVSRFLRFVLVAGAALASATAAAQPYPSKPVKIIIPWVSGGAVEALVRVVANKMTDLGQPLVLEARPGANGTIGAAAVAKSAPDGYTLLVGHVGPLAISPAMQAMQYDSIKDFEPIGQLVSGPTLLVIRPDIPVKTVRELVDYAKVNPGKLSYGSVGIGSTTHLAGEVLALATGINIVHVPYKGAPPIVTDLLGGRISFAFAAVTSVLPQARAGQLRVLGITSLQRSPLLPEFAPVSETVPGFELSSWHGLLAPAGTPRAIVARVHESMAAALKQPEVIQWLKENGLDPVGSRPEEFGAYIRGETAKWAKIVKDAKIPPQ